MAKSRTVSPARLAAFEILLRVEDGAYASVLLASRDEELSQPDRALTNELVLGVLRNQLWLDRMAEHYSRRKSDEFDVEVRLILRLGLYQLDFLTRIPVSAAVNESVNLASVARKRSAGALINAVLRRAAVDSDYDPVANIDDPKERLAVETSHPSWLIDRWVHAFGFEETQALARSNNTEAPVSFRVVRNRADETDVLRHLKETGAEIKASTVANRAWRIARGGRPLADMASAGKVYIQDEASQLLTAILAPKSGDRVLDLCAAPGSKTTHIADVTRDSAFIVAADLHEHRLRGLAASAKLQGFSRVNCVRLDGLQPLPFPQSYFDRVLVDAPCSGTGTLRRNPEIRWRISTGDIEDLAARQKQLLINASRTVKIGGRLVYSTCSVETEENENVRQSFIENSNNFRQAKPDLDSSLITSVGAVRTWPHRQGSDGFFMCAFERIN